MLLVNELLAEPILMLLIQFSESMQVLRGQSQFLLLVLTRKDKEDNFFAIDWRFHWGLPFSWEESESPFVLLLLFKWYFYTLLLQFYYLVLDVLAVEDIPDVYLECTRVLY